MTINDAKLIKLPRITDSRGNLSFAEQNNQVPFVIQRTYWIYDVPGGEDRGGHAYKDTSEFIIAISGCFDVIVNDGYQQTTFTLNRSYYGLYIPKGLWRQISNFSTNSVALEFADTVYNENDYIRNYEQFKLMKINGEI